MNVDFLSAIPQRCRPQQQSNPATIVMMQRLVTLVLATAVLAASTGATATTADGQQHVAAAAAQDWIRIPLATNGREHTRRRLQHLVRDNRHGTSNDDEDILSSTALRELHIALQQQRIRRRLGETPSPPPPSPAPPTTTNSSSFDNATQMYSMVYSQVPLGVGYGTHYAELYLGVPAQRASVIVDTGSHLTALPCSSCVGCGDHTDPYFDMSKSTTATFATCKSFSACNTCSDDRCFISQSYTEGSMWRAVVVHELVWVGGLRHTNNSNVDAIMRHFGVQFPLGCQTYETGLFITQKENGIMGMGRHSATVLATMVAAKRVQHDVFALCFGVHGGGLVLGGVDPTLHASPIQFTPLLVDASGWYPVKLHDIRVGGASLGAAATANFNSGKGVIVDSGTTDTFFVAAAARAFNAAFVKASGGIAYSTTKMDVRSVDAVAKLPLITLVLDGMSSNGSDNVVLELPPTKYLTLSEDGAYYYGNVHFTERSGGVLGASTMMGYDVVFDTENKRIGFAAADCDAASLPQNRTDDDASAATDAATHTTDTNDDATTINNTADDSVNANRFMLQLVGVSVVGVLLVAVAWRCRLRQRAWHAIPHDSTLGTPKEEDYATDDDVHDQQQLQQMNQYATEPPDSTTSTTAVRSPPRRQQVVSPRAAVLSPKFTIGSDDEDDFKEARTFGGRRSDEEAKEAVDVAPLTSSSMHRDIGSDDDDNDDGEMV